MFRNQASSKWWKAMMVGYRLPIMALTASMGPLFDAHL
jgi:hypothetical protein